jgi:hypothetical protein
VFFDEAGAIHRVLNQSFETAEFFGPLILPAGGPPVVQVPAPTGTCRR